MKHEYPGLSTSEVQEELTKASSDKTLYENGDDFSRSEDCISKQGGIINDNVNNVSNININDVLYDDNEFDFLLSNTDTDINNSTVQEINLDIQVDRQLENDFYNNLILNNNEQNI